MKKNLQILMMMVLWGTFFLMRGYGQNQNLNDYLAITSFAIYDAEDQAIPLNRGDDPANYSFGLASGEFAEIKFTYTINTGDYLIRAGDSVTIPMVYAINNDFIYTDFSATPIYDNDNNKIGTIRKNFGVLTITFSDHAVGKTTLNGSFSSGHSVKRHLSSSLDEVRNFRFNGVDYKYLAEKIDRKPISTERFSKACEASSSSSIMWNLGFFRRIERYLSDPAYATNRQDTNWVNQNMRFSDVYVEDTISDAGASRVSPPAFTALIFPPMSDDNPTTSTQATGTSVSITSFFTRLYPIAGESLDDFRDRVKSAPLQYGAYKVSDGLFVFMAFMGNWPNSGITYQNSGCETNVNNTTNPNWSDTQKQLWREVHAADNCLGGAVGVFTIQFNVEYSSPVVIETQKRNVAWVYMSELTWPSASVGTMKPTAQEAIPQTGTVKLVKFDEESRQPIAGIKFSLQRWDGTAWVSHSIQDVSSWTTGNNGIIEISNVVDGRYRFVEDNTTAFDSGYDATKIKFYSNSELTTEITEFTVDANATEGVLLYASNGKLVQYREKYFYKNIADLPADVRATLPTRDTVYYNGNVVIPESPSETTVTVGYYQYDFEGWDSTQITINNADAVFTGSWKKTALPVYLTVQKMVTGNPNGYDKDWTFELTVPQEVVSQVSDITSTPPITFNANGKASFTMKHGDSRTFAIPCGTVISIMETGTKGYEVSHDGVGKLNSNYSETVTDSTFNLTNMILEEHVTIAFINKKLYTVTYKPGTQGMFADDVHSGLNYYVSTPSFAGLKDGSGRPLGNPGYEFIGWDKEVKSFVTEDAEYVAQWGAASDSDACRVPMSNITLGTHTETTCTPMTVDGEVYPVVLINGHCWTKENLRTATPNSMVYSTDMNPADETTYGRLYTYSEATSLCPAGWHLPTSVETAALTTYDAWGLMSVDNWIVDGTDKSGFSAQPAGFYSYATQRFEGMRSTTGFLTDTEGDVFVINYYCCSANMEHTNSGNAYSVRCVKSDNCPRVTTTAATGVASDSARINGEVTNIIGTVEDYGFVWGTDRNTITTTVNGSDVTTLTADGVFASDLKGLAPCDTVWFMAFAKTSECAETIYGDTLFFKLKMKMSDSATCAPIGDALPCPGIPVVYDHEGNDYNTVQIGNQCWTKENMRCKTSPNGYLFNGMNFAGSNAAYFYEDDLPIPLKDRGLLYNWAGAMDTTRVGNFTSQLTLPRRGICPQGWHVPSIEEWEILLNYVSSKPCYICGENNDTNIAKALSSKLYWEDDDDCCTVGSEKELNNATGFSAVPIGSPIAPLVFSKGYYNKFWSSTIATFDGSYNEPWSLSIHYARSFVETFDQQSLHISSVRCLKDDNTVALPTVTTDAVECDGTTGGNVTYEGGSNVTARGVCWGTSPNPTIADNRTIDGAGSGSFASNINLTKGIKYFVRAYATNTYGTSYGNQVIYVNYDSASCPGIPTVTDHEGNVYNTVQIGNQCWTRENMRAKSSPKGPGRITEGSGTNADVNAHYYDDASSSLPLESRGLLYNRYAALDTISNAEFENHRGICPEGWHVPTESEWGTLRNYIRTLCDTCKWNSRVLATKQHWNSSDVECAIGNDNSKNNAVGFSAYPVGYFMNRAFREYGNNTWFWSSSRYDNNPVGGVMMTYDSYYINTFNFTAYGGMGNAFSVRCVKDSEYLPCPGTPTVSDHQGNVYNTVQIGDQCWTRENMRCTTSPNGNLQAGGKGVSSRNACYYDYQSSTIPLEDRGLLYNWAAALDTIFESNVDASYTNRRGICPEGWHVPSHAEWNTLVNYLKTQTNYICGGNTNNVAKSLASNQYWEYHDSSCAIGNDQIFNNATGFTAVPAGYCYGSSFSSAGYNSYFWTSTHAGTSSHDEARFRNIWYGDSIVKPDYNTRETGFSVRCLKDN